MEACSEKWELADLASPRISFSHDLPPSDLSAAETRRLDSSLPFDSPADDDFDFSRGVDISTDDPSLADELFSEGKLLPLPIKNPSAPSTPPLPTVPNTRKHGSLRDIMARSEDDGSVKRSPSPLQKSFWLFRRSSSMNYSGGRWPGLICPFPLLRSKSTGSSPAPNPPPVRRPDKQHTKTNQTSNNASDSSSFLIRKASTGSNGRIYYYSGARRSCGHGVRISPILNVPAAGSAFGHLLCSCGDNKRRGSAVTCSP